MFGDVAVDLLKLMGHSGTVPGAIRAEDVEAALSRLRAGLTAREAESVDSADSGQDDEEYEEEEYEDLSVVDRAQQEQRRSMQTTVLAAVAVITGIVLISAAAIVGGFTLWYQNISDRWAAQLDTLDLAAGAADFQTVIFYDATGNEIAELQSEDGGAPDVTFFELLTLAAMVSFRDAQIDVARRGELAGHHAVFELGALDQRVRAGERPLDGGGFVDVDREDERLARLEAFEREGDRRFFGDCSRASGHSGRGRLRPPD